VLLDEGKLESRKYSSHFVKYQLRRLYPTTHSLPSVTYFIPRAGCSVHLFLHRRAGSAQADLFARCRWLLRLSLGADRLLAYVGEDLGAFSGLRLAALMKSREFYLAKD
jgi:hypothetical protein